ncbi:transposase [Clostridium lundense]|uniref:transposase n=1 Tax=Clostridium lundense TaxID=319475 RepID=UPI00048822CC|nr:transposase [Clostridium lundense]
MPRTARVKCFNGIYHITMRSFKEFNLFKNSSDKDKFLNILKKYKDIFLFKVFAYCLMDTHVHLLIHSNGADISKFMHSINQSYAQYYNKKHNRYGHVFSDRFKSIIAEKDTDIILMSAYIHNNPKDIKGYKNCVENYNYSSYSTYLGNKDNIFNLIDFHPILNYFNEDLILSRKRYYNFVKNRLSKATKLIDIKWDVKSDEHLKNSIDYINEKTPLIRSLEPEDVMNFIYKSCNIDSTIINIKYNKKISAYRSICVLIMRCFCNFTFNQISQVISNYTQSYLSKLCSKGYELISNDPDYKIILDSFLYEYSFTY